MNGVQHEGSTLCPLSLFHRKAQVVSFSYAQNKAQKYHPQNSLATAGSFKCNTYLTLYTNTVLLWARGSVAHNVGWPDLKMAASINVLAFTRRYFHWGTNAHA